MSNMMIKNLAIVSTFALFVSQIQSLEDKFVFEQTLDKSACNEWRISRFELATTDPNYRRPKAKYTRLSDYKPANLSLIESGVLKRWRGMKPITEINRVLNIQCLWGTFGAASKKIDRLNTEYKYFSKSFELFDKFNMNNILRGGNVTSGRNYTVQEVLGAVSEGLQGKKSLLLCSNDGSYFWLEKISILLDDSFNPVDFNPEDSSKCPDNRLIGYLI